jgi:hypothetical protein
MDYTALIAAWNSATQPPAGITGAALTGLTTAQKLAAVKAWTTAGAAIAMVIPTYKIYNVIDTTEFSALSATNQQLVRDILGMGTVDASPGTSIRTRILAIFGAATATRAALTALAAPFDTPTVKWADKNGYADLTLNDIAAAGLT